MYDLPKSLVELKLEEENVLLRHENERLKWDAGMRSDEQLPGLTASHPVQLPQITTNLTLAVGAGFKVNSDGFKYFGYTKGERSYEIGMFISGAMLRSTLNGSVSARYHLDYLNRNIQNQLLEGLKKA